MSGFDRTQAKEHSLRVVFAFYDSEEIDLRMGARLATQAGLRAEVL